MKRYRWILRVGSLLMVLLTVLAVALIVELGG